MSIQRVTTDAELLTETETCEHVDVVNNLLTKQYAMINYGSIAKINSYSAIAVLTIKPGIQQKVSKAMGAL